MISRWCLCIPSIVARQRLYKSFLFVDRQRLGKNPPIVPRKRLRKNHRIVARQRLSKNPLNVARQPLGRNVTVVTITHATIEESTHVKVEPANRNGCIMLCVVNLADEEF
jgi:hypothetical protein